MLVANEAVFVSWGTPSCYNIDEKLKCALHMELVFRQRLIKNMLFAKLMFLNWQQQSFRGLCLLLAVSEVQIFLN